MGALVVAGTFEALMLVSVMTCPAIYAQHSSTIPSTATPALKFEVASIKICKDRSVARDTGLKGGGRTSGSSSPDSLYLPCSSVRFLIRLAYIITPARLNPMQANPELEGGPAWIDSDRYKINAKAQDPVGKDMIRGPMLQALLVDRFHLTIHRETREVPIYELTVAKKGLRLQPTNGESCNPVDLTQSSLPPPAPGQKPWCGLLRGGINSHQITIDLPGASMAEFARSLLKIDRPVIDKTGITEKFDFHLEYAPEGADASDDATAQSIFSALGQLGLKLELAKGPRDFLVIDSVEKPSEN